MANNEANGTAAPQLPAGTVKLACKGVWKLFGSDPKRFLEGHNFAPNAEQIAEAGLIGAVQDASFEVAEGRNFYHHGPVGFGQIDARALHVAPDRADGGRDPVPRARTCRRHRKRS